MGETQTPNSYDFVISEPVTKPQNQLFLSLEPPRHLQKIQKSHIFLNILNLSISEFRNSDHFTFFEKTGTDN